MPKKIASELDWIHLGMQAFAEGGEAALIVEKLAKQLGSSKTSFYWYFKDRSVFLNRVIEQWRERTTTAIIAHNAALAKASPDVMVRQLLVVMFSHNAGGDFMFYLRRLGQTDTGYFELLGEVERKRLSYMSGLLIRSGFSPEDAVRASELVYSYYLGWYERNRFAGVSAETAEAQADFLMKFIGLKTNEKGAD